MRGALIRPLSVAAIGWALVAVVGSLATDIGPWYRSLAKPPWQPPDWVFGPVWTTIFVLCAVSAALTWRSAEAAARPTVVALFVVNGLLNVLWSFLFFYLKRPFLAGLEIILLWASIAVLIWYLGQRSRMAALLLLPYLLWVSFATAINWTIIQLNS